MLFQAFSPVAPISKCVEVTILYSSDTGHAEECAKAVAPLGLLKFGGFGWQAREAGLLSQKQKHHCL